MPGKLQSTRLYNGAELQIDASYTTRTRYLQHGSTATGALWAPGPPSADLAACLQLYAWLNRARRWVLRSISEEPLASSGLAAETHREDETSPPDTVVTRILSFVLRRMEGREGGMESRAEGNDGSGGMLSMTRHPQTNTNKTQHWERDWETGEGKQNAEQGTVQSQTRV